MAHDSGQAGTEIKITPEMIEAARVSFHGWMTQWDYLADGLPAEADVDELLSFILASGLLKKPVGN